MDHYFFVKVWKIQEKTTFPTNFGDIVLLDNDSYVVTSAQDPTAGITESPLYDSTPEFLIR